MMFLLINTGYKKVLGVLAVPKLVSVQSALSVSEIKNKFSKNITKLTRKRNASSMVSLYQ